MNIIANQRSQYKFVWQDSNEGHKQRARCTVAVANSRKTSHSWHQGKTPKDYDKSKRRRKIVPSSKEEFKWLISDETVANSGKLYCQQCRGVYGPLVIRKTASDRIKRYANWPFVVGSTNLMHDALKTHKKSKGHKYAVEFTASRNKPQGESSAEKKYFIHYTKLLFQNCRKFFSKCTCCSLDLLIIVVMWTWWTERCWFR